MNALGEVLDAACEVQSLCAGEGWRFCFIGGIAIQRWGTPRFTHDADLTLLTGFGEEESFVVRLLRAFKPRIPDAAEMAIRNRVLLLRAENGVEIDIAMGAVPFEERSVGRATLWEMSNGRSLTTCSADDLVVHKVFAGRPRDWDDVERVLTRQMKKLNFAQIETELAPLLDLKNESESLRKLAELRRIVSARLKGDL